MKRVLLTFVLALAVIGFASSASAEVDPTPQEPIKVVVPAPTFTDPTCEENVIQHNEQETEGISWWVDDSHEDNRLTLTVTAEAHEGYEIDGQSVWEHTYTPLLDEETCNPEKTKATPTLPDTGPPKGLLVLFGVLLLALGTGIVTRQWYSNE